MSRIAKSPVEIPSGVEVVISKENEVSVKKDKVFLTKKFNTSVKIMKNDNILTFEPKKNAGLKGWSHAGTIRSIVNSMVLGVTKEFEKRLQLVGVGYRAKVQGKKLNLVLGFSHPVEHVLPEGVTAETPSQTEIVLRSADKQVVGQVAAQIRSYRPPEPYKGKGVRYVDEYILRKEAKKK